MLHPKCKLLSHRRNRLGRCLYLPLLHIALMTVNFHFHQVPTLQQLHRMRFLQNPMRRNSLSILLCNLCSMERCLLWLSKYHSCSNLPENNLRILIHPDKILVREPRLFPNPRSLLLDCFLHRALQNKKSNQPLLHQNSLNSNHFA